MGQSRGSNQAGTESVRSRVDPKGSSRKEGNAKERSRSQGSGTNPQTKGRTPEGRHRRPRARAEPQGEAKVGGWRKKPDGAHEARARPRNGHQLFGEDDRDEVEVGAEWMDCSSGRGRTGWGWFTIGPRKVPRSQDAFEDRFADPWKGHGREGATSTSAPKGFPEVTGAGKPQPVAARANVLVAEELVITGPIGLLALPFVRSGSSGAEHEASEQPPWQDDVDPSWRNRTLSCAVLEGHEVKKPKGADRLTPKTSVSEVRGTGHASGQTLGGRHERPEASADGPKWKSL